MIQHLPFANTGSFSNTFLDYISGNEKLKNFYSLSPKLENFKTQLEAKKESYIPRDILVEALRRQYKGVPTNERVTKNIEALVHAKTFTITTGHQLCLATGPLYFIYKIITVLNTVKKLQSTYPDYTFVPVFWMASEDHDVEEINHFNVFGKTWKWETAQRGAVGRFSTEGIQQLCDTFPEKIALLEKHYSSQHTLAGATRSMVNELFGAEGLVTIDGDDVELKKAFSPILQDELLHHHSHSLVTKTTEQLEGLGYEAQIHAREINLFYLSSSSRERIVKEKELYKVLNTSISFTEQELFIELEKHPENFSPNVVLRPLYQEFLLPNLAYVGGPAEVVYWLQLKPLFEHYNIPFPILMPRNFSLYLTKQNVQKLKKLDIDISDLFLPADKLKNKFLATITAQEFKLTQEQQVIQELYAKIKEKASAIDKTLEATVMADLQKSIKLLEDLEKKLKKAEERKNETVISQLLNLKQKLFPNDSLQERHDNFLNFALNNPSFLAIIQQSFDPFNFSFHLISEHE